MLMDKRHGSSIGAQSAVRVAIALWLCSAGLLGAITLTRSEAQSIGRKVWQNECNGTVSGLTSWNAGEDFASLGIGHFIWYPKGRPGPFEESFPRLVSFISGRGAKLPNLLLGTGELHCPWNSRQEFQREQQSAEMKQLRQFLADTVDLQAEFLAERLQEALPKMLAEAAPDRREQVEQQFQRVASSASGRYALIDYVNFKGEGVLHTERYKGQGWGLLQVLEGMNGSESGVAGARDFARSAREVLTRRVKNSPPERKESRWLSGWLRRVDTYTH